MKNLTARSSWILLLFVGGLFPVFGYGKLFEPGPPYDDPLGGGDAIFEFAQISAIPIGLCILLGMIGFYSFYHATLGKTGKLGWVLTGIGGLVIFLGALIYVPTRNETFWTLLLMGNFISAFGLIVIGIAALRNQFLPKWNWSPFIIGLIYTFIFLGGSLFPDYEASLTAGIVIFVLTSIGWALFGTALRVGATPS